MLTAQNFETFTEARHSGSVTYLDLEFFDDSLLYVTGWHRDSGTGILWKYNHQGQKLDSVLLKEHESHSQYLIKKEGDSILTFGIDQINDIKYFTIRSFDKDLSLMWTKFTEMGQHGLIRKFRGYPLIDKFYIFIQHSAGISWFKLDEKYDTEQHIYDDQIPATMPEPIRILDSGFVFSKLFWERIIDTSFSYIDTSVFPYVDSLDWTPFGDALPTKDGIWYCGRSGQNDHYSMIHLSDNYQQITTYPGRGSYGQNSRYAHLRSIASNKDSTVIYSAGLMTDAYPYWVPFGSDSAYPFWVSRMNPDTLLWQKYYTDGYYYHPLNMEVGPDDALYLACTRYDVRNQPAFSESVVLRINKDGIIGGTVGLDDNHDVINSNETQVYPNPGNKYLNIEIPEVSAAKLYLYNLQGKIMNASNFRKKYRLNTSAMSTGVYIYKIVSHSGKIYSGKWIKK